MAALDYLKNRGLAAKQVGNKLLIVPKEKITSLDRAYIKLHRMEMLAELAANDGLERRAHWSVLRGGKVIATIAGEPMSHAEALTAAQFRWPDAEVH